MSSIVENRAYSPSQNVENEENPGITRFFRWKTTRKTVKHVLEKCFPTSRKPLCKNFKKRLWAGLFRVFANFPAWIQNLLWTFQESVQTVVFFRSPPLCFPVSQAVFQGFPHWFPIISTVFHIPWIKSGKLGKHEVDGYGNFHHEWKESWKTWLSTSRMVELIREKVFTIFQANEN